jgi:hypothetical protein
VIDLSIGRVDTEELEWLTTEPHCMHRLLHFDTTNLIVDSDCAALLSCFTDLVRLWPSQWVVSPPRSACWPQLQQLRLHVYRKAHVDLQLFGDVLAACTRLDTLDLLSKMSDVELHQLLLNVPHLTDMTLRSMRGLSDLQSLHCVPELTQLTLFHCLDLPAEALHHLIGCRRLRQAFITCSSDSSMSKAELAPFTPNSSSFDAAGLPQLHCFSFQVES